MGQTAGVSWMSEFGPFNWLHRQKRLGMSGTKVHPGLGSAFRVFTAERQQLRVLAE
jgi:hypothetical protein